MRWVTPCGWSSCQREPCAQNTAGRMTPPLCGQATRTPLSRFSPCTRCAPGPRAVRFMGRVVRFGGLSPRLRPKRALSPLPAPPFHGGRGVWTFPAWLTGGRQPAGLAEGGRWGQRGRNDHRETASDGRAPRRGASISETGPEPPRDDGAALHSGPPGPQYSQPRSGRLGSDKSGTLPGCRAFAASLPGGRRPPTLGDLRLPSANPAG